QLHALRPGSAIEEGKALASHIARNERRLGESARRAVLVHDAATAVEDEDRVAEGAEDRLVRDRDEIEEAVTEEGPADDERGDAERDRSVAQRRSEDDEHDVQAGG